MIDKLSVSVPNRLIEAAREELGLAGKSTSEVLRAALIAAVGSEESPTVKRGRPSKESTETPMTNAGEN